MDQLPRNTDEFTTQMPGRNNILWRWGKQRLYGKDLDFPNWIGELESWLDEVESRDDWWTGYERYAPVARNLALAMGRIFLAAKYLDTSRDREFLEYLDAACQCYAAALSPESLKRRPSPVPGELPQQTLTAWWRDDKRVVRLGMIDQYLTAFEKSLPATAIGMARFALSDLVEPQQTDRKLLGQQVFDVQTPVVLVTGLLGQQNNGVPLSLTVEWFVRPGVEPVLVRDPAALGCTVLDPVFSQTERYAWQLARNCFKEGGFVRWGLDLNQEADADAVALSGNSAGGGLAVALVSLAEKRKLATDAAILACLRADEDAGVKTISGRFGDVGSVAQKASAAYHKRRVRRVIFWKAEGLDDPEARKLDEVIRDDNPGLVVERLGSVREAVDRISGRVAAVVEFLRRYACNGLTANLTFKPTDWDVAYRSVDWGAGKEEISQRIAPFCQPTQVITDEEWRRLRKRAEQAGRGSSGIAERDYAPLTYLTYELGLQNEEPVRPRNLESVLGDLGQPHILLRGEPGEGKTTALWTHTARRCLDLAEKIASGQLGLDDPEMRLPLVLPLSALQPSDEDGSLADAAVRWAYKMAYDSATVPDQVQEWLKSRIAQTAPPGYELCLDALDEMASQSGTVGRRDWLRRQLNQLAHVPVVLTSRLDVEARNLLVKRQELRVVCFGPRQINNYVDGYFRNKPKLTAKVRQRLAQSPGPRHLAQIPLLLGALCATLEDSPDQELPGTRTGLLGLGLQRLLRRGDEDRNRPRKDDETFFLPRRSRDETKEQFLYHVAWKYHAVLPLPMGGRELRQLLREHLSFFDDNDKPRNGEELLREYLRDGIIVPLAEDSYRFVLRSFHEYCLAGWIAQESPPARMGDRAAFGELVRGGAAEWNRPDWGELRPFKAETWRNIWPLVAGHLKAKAGWLIALYQDDSEAATIASEAPADCVERIDLIRKLIEEMQDGRISLIERQCCAEALGRIGCTKATTALAERLQDGATPRDVRRASAKALGRIGGPDATSALSQCLRDIGSCRVWPEELQGNFLRQAEAVMLIQWSCAEALGRICDYVAASALVERLRDDNIDITVREFCAMPLGRIGGSEVTSALVERLYDNKTHESLQKICAWGLCAIGGPEATEALVERLNNPETSRDMRWVYADVLGKMGTEATKTLRERLSDATRPIAERRACAVSLGKIGGPEAIKSLAKGLRDAATPTEVCMVCVSELGGKRCPEATKALVERLNDGETPTEVRSACAFWLSRIGGPEATKGLVERLRDAETPTVVRCKCAEAFGTIDGPEAITALAECLSDTAIPQVVLRACADVLGRIGPEAIRTLVERLRSAKTPLELRSACVALGDKIRGPLPTLALMKCLRDAETPPGVRIVCADVLGRIIGGTEATEALVECLRDAATPTQVRGASAEVLGRIGGTEVTTALVECLRDGMTPTEVRRACAEALLKIGGPAATEAMMELLRDVRSQTEATVVEAPTPISTDTSSATDTTAS